MRTIEQGQKSWKEYKRGILIMIEQAELFVDDNPQLKKQIKHLKSLIRPEEEKDYIKNYQ